MKLGTNDIGSVYLGTNAVQKVYLGANEVWSSYAYLLNDYSGAAAAYSLRLLRSAYTGDAIRVRRASDNTEQDIGFVANELDTSALTTFCSGTDGFVKTWYDQSGNGYDATQTTSANQPQIVSSGSVITENGKPSAQFDGSNDFLTSSGFGTGEQRSVFFAMRGNGDGSGYENYFIFLANLPSNLGNFMQLYSTDYTSVAINNFPTASLDITSTTALDTQQIVSLLKTSTTSNIYQNSINTGSGSGSQSLENQLSIGNFSTNFAFFKMQEMIIYNADQSSNRTGIETNINNFYSIY